MSRTQKKAGSVGQPAGLPIAATLGEEQTAMNGKKISTPAAAASPSEAPAFDPVAYLAQLVAEGVPQATAEKIVADKQASEQELAALKSAGPARRKRITPVKPATPIDPATGLPAKASREKPIKAVFDYRYDDLPERIRDLIETHLAIESADAKSAGTLGFMTRALALATLPHRRVNDFRFVRQNGDFTLTMMTAHPEGLPYGTLPRLLLTWVCTEAVQTKERVLNLGDNLADYLTELGLHATGGKRGDITRLKHAMTTLFASVISAQYDGRNSWALSNVLLADKVEWWRPQDHDEAGTWQSRLQLSEPFFRECLEHPLPIDTRAMRGLRRSPLALDIYVWLTHRMSYLSKRTMIPWVLLKGQFGASYAHGDQGLLDFKRAFLRELKNVLVVYPEARLADDKNGLVLYPSPTHVLPTQRLRHSQPKLF